MAYRVEGDYLEACDCTVSCPCIFLGPATEDRCHVFLAWHLASGYMDGVDLSGLNVALAVDSPKRMTEGNWRVALYLDERADQAQSAALQAIFSGGAGGYLAALAPLIGEVTGIHSAPIEFWADARRRRLRVGDVLEVAVEQTTGLDGENATEISNPPLMAVPQAVRQARSEKLTYRGAWNVELDGRNSFVTEFAYSA